jgi:hypothetical protein
MKSSIPVGRFQLLKFPAHPATPAGGCQIYVSAANAAMFATFQKLPEHFQERFRRLVDRIAGLLQGNGA